ncbi:unnamed protein product, partial [Ixodes hexagonus]
TPEDQPTSPESPIVPRIAPAPRPKKLPLLPRGEIKVVFRPPKRAKPRHMAGIPRHRKHCACAGHEQECDPHRYNGADPGREKHCRRQHCPRRHRLQAPYGPVAHLGRQDVPHSYLCRWAGRLHQGGRARCQAQH